MVMICGLNTFTRRGATAPATVPLTSCMVVAAVSVTATVPVASAVAVVALPTVTLSSVALTVTLAPPNANTAALTVLVWSLAVSVIVMLPVVLVPATAVAVPTTTPPALVVTVTPALPPPNANTPLLVALCEPPIAVPGTPGFGGSVNVMPPGAKPSYATGALSATVIRPVASLDRIVPVGSPT